MIVLPVARAGDTGTGTWLTGELYVEDRALFFRTDSPIKGNSLGNVLLVSATSDAEDALFPIFLRAVQRNVKLRLYGVIVPYTDTIPGHAGPLPNKVLFASRVHMPSDSDDLPDKIHLNEKLIDRYKGNRP
jgi:hypothetical protein